MSRDFSAMAARVSGGTVRTAGRIEFVRDQGPLRRDIRVHGFKWDPEIHRNLAKTLWAVERAHSYGMAALRLFSKMSSSEFSPDGLLGGRGYIQKVKDLRAGLSQAVEVLSSFSDTMHDEVNADHWHSAMEADPTTEQIVTEAEQANPGEYVEQQFQQEVPSAEEGLESYRNPEPDDFNPFLEGEEPEDEEGGIWDWGGDGSVQTSAEKDQSKARLLTEDEVRARGRKYMKEHGLSGTASAAGGEEVPEPGPKSKLPTDSGHQEEGSSVVEMVMNTTGEADVGKLASMASRTAAFRRSGEPMKVADSSVDPETLSPPRVMHVGPGESPEEFGYDTEWWDRPSDDPLGEGFRSLDRIYEGADACADGTTGYSDPTDGDVTTFKEAALRVAGNTYSWLPGSRNEKIMPYYDRSVTADDQVWMMAHDSPDPPDGLRPRVVKPPSDPLWDAVNDGQLPSN